MTTETGERAGASATWGPGRRALATLVWVGLASALQLIRVKGVPPWDTIWAEDGSVFLTEALSSPLGSLVRPAGGHLQLVSRLWAGLASALPIAWAAGVLAVGSAVSIGALSAYVFRALRGLLGSPLPRGALAAFFVLAPAWGFESLATTPGLRFALLVAAFAALADRPATRAGSAVAAVVAALAALSTPLALLLVPIAAWRLAAAGSPLERAAPIAVLAGGTVQALALALTAAGSADLGLAHIADLSAFPRAYGVRVLGDLAVGDRFVDNVARLGAGSVGTAALALLVVATAVVTPWIRGERRVWVPAAIVASMTAFAGPLLASGEAAFAVAGEPPILLSNRYVVAPVLLLATAAFLFLSAERWPRRLAQSLGAALAMVLLVQVVVNFRVRTPRSDGPRWSSQVEVARLSCQIVPTPIVAVPVPPVLDPEGRPAWSATLPCARLGA